MNIRSMSMTTLSQIIWRRGIKDRRRICWIVKRKISRNLCYTVGKNTVGKPAEKMEKRTEEYVSAVSGGEHRDHSAGCSLSETERN